MSDAAIEPRTAEFSAVRSFGVRKNNAELMLDCAALGYLDGRVLDMTYGKGRFWKLHRPIWLITNDIDRSTDAVHHQDFTDLDCGDDFFNSVVFDGPYKLNGTGGSHPSDAGYGVASKGSIKGRMGLLYAGVTEGLRVLAPKGFLLVKCQDQVCSGEKVWQTDLLTDFVAASSTASSVRKVDTLHVQSYRPQPAGTRQLHSRGDYSTLLVFRKGK